MSPRLNLLRSPLNYLAQTGIPEVESTDIMLFVEK
jgi:hypothetical protein